MTYPVRTLLQPSVWKGGAAQLAIESAGIPVVAATEGDNLEAVTTFSSLAPSVSLYIRRGATLLRQGAMAYSGGAWRFALPNVSPGDQATGNKTWVAIRDDSVVATNDYTVNIPDVASYGLATLRDRSRYQVVASIEPRAIGIVFRVMCDLTTSGSLLSNQTGTTAGWRVITTTAGNMQFSVRQTSGLFLNHTVPGLNLDAPGNLGKLSTAYFHYEGIGGVGPSQASVNRAVFATSAAGTGFTIATAGTLLATGLSSYDTANPLYEQAAGVVTSDVELFGFCIGDTSLTIGEAQAWADACKAAGGIVGFGVGASVVQDPRCFMNNRVSMRTWPSGYSMDIGGDSGVGFRKPQISRVLAPVWNF